MNSIVAKAVVITAIIALIVGFFGGYEWKNLNASAPISAPTSPISPNKVTLSNVPADAPGITGDIGSDNGLAFGTAVMENMTDQFAVGLAQAVNDNPNATAMSATNLIKKIVPSAQASSCLEIANAAIKKSLEYWLPSQTGACAEITGSYTAAYSVKSYKINLYGSSGIAGGALIRVTLSPDQINVRWRDPECKIKATPLNIKAITRYYDVEWSLLTNSSLHSLSETQYNRLVTPRSDIIVTPWCSGAISDAVLIGDISKCPRCNKPY